ncbi:MAG TPA: hypothetical protein VHL78_00135 [Actinomycetota bacterium]|nr:hypothetical protein [Actinomycetota bacterium]
MAVTSERLITSRSMPGARGLAALILALSVTVTLLYVSREAIDRVPVSKGLSAEAIHNSRAFVREQGAPQIEVARIFGSGAYIREAAGATLVSLSAEAIAGSRAFVREQGTPPIFGSGAYLREIPGAVALSFSPEVLWNSAAHTREQAETPKSQPLHTTWAHVREAPA